MEAISIYAQRLLDSKEYFERGHRACQGCGETIALRHLLKATGRNVIVANATGCSEIISSPLPTTSWTVPWIHVAFENTAAVASGVEAGLKALTRKGRIAPKRVKVLAIAGDGGTADIGLQALSGALERGHDMIFVCLDNEAYMNTGIQRSSSTPFGAGTTTSPPGKKSIGQQTWKKNMPEIAAAHQIPYVATACPSYPFDLLAKVEKAVKTRGPSYLHVLAVCPTGWRCGADLTVRLGRIAVETGIFPLFEVENGTYRITHAPRKLRPIHDYIGPQGRFRHLGPDEVKVIEARVKREYEALRKKAGLDS